MADIQGKILDKYGIDIAQENIFKLYKIDSSEISQQELDEKIASTRKRWNQSINGANEKNAERDRARLEKADKYEAILKDAKLRKELSAFYNGGGEQKAQAQAAGSAGGTEFAREYFKLVETSKKLRRADVEFFFDYYQSERKNKKAILEMLEKDFKLNFIGKGGKHADEDEDKDVDIDGKTKDESSPLIVNLFQKATILKLRKCVEFYEKTVQSNDVCQRYPNLRDGLYDFLGLKEIETIQQFTDLVSAKGKQVYADRQERGSDYIPLVDLFNTLQTLSGYRDVVDNLPEFKLLVKYPNLTPYMFAFVDMKPATLKGIINVANRDYVFRDDADFILNYYNPVHDNFGISNSGINSLIKKAEKKAKSNKVLNEIDNKLGRTKKRKISIGAEIIHWLVYWPIFVVYFVFEVFKAVFTRLHKFVVPVFIFFFVGANWMFPKKFNMENLLVLGKIFSKAEWYAYLDEFVGEKIGNGFEAVVLSLIAIIVMVAVYVLPSLFASMFISVAADDLNKRYDWVGYERTFRNILDTLRKKTENQYLANRKLFFKNKAPKAIINIVCLIILALIIYLIPVGFRAFSERTGYFQKTEVSEQNYDDADDYEETAGAMTSIETEESESDEFEELIMVITEASSNIRSGPGTDFNSLMVASKGDIFIATGNQETASNGRIWYEIYLDEDKAQTGWASEKVIAVQE